MYWQFIGADKPSMAEAYFNATKRMEEGVYNYVIAKLSLVLRHITRAPQWGTAD